jgi:hypothetical protein
VRYTRTISVAADKIVGRVSNVDIYCRALLRTDLQGRQAMCDLPIVISLN